MKNLSLSFESMKNTFLFALKGKNFKILFNKFLLRFSDKKGKISKTEYKNWLQDNLSDFESVAQSINKDIWEESKQFSKELDLRAGRILSQLDISIGGGGLYPFLYFLTRTTKPQVVLETGVAAGFSSQAILKAMEQNGTGILYSSDLPYFRIAEPEKYIGIIVEEQLKSRWNLFIKGDKLNLDKILPQIRSIDIFHYDSDKSYIGRETVWNRVLPFLTHRSTVIFDDIDDNTQFYDLIEKHKIKNFHIFYLKRKYIGVIHPFKS